MHKSFKLIALVIALVASILCFTSCSKSNERVLNLYNWTYYTPDSVIELFEEKYDCKVVLSYFSSNEEMFAKIAAGGASGYDIIIPSADYTSIMIKQGMCTPLDHDKLPNLKYLSPLVLSKVTYDPSQTYSVPYFMGSPGIMVNKSKVQQYDRDWSIFADTSLAGKMTMLDDMRETMGAAASYLGYSVNTIDPEELKAMENLLTNVWKPNLVKFDAEGFGKAFSRGEFWAVHGYPEGVFTEVSVENWGNIDFFMSPKGGTIYIDNMLIPKNAKHVDLAHEFINFILDPQIYAMFLDAFHFPSTCNSEAAQYMTVTPFYDAQWLSNHELMVDLGENLATYTAIWERVKYGTQ